MRSRFAGIRGTGLISIDNKPNGELHTKTKETEPVSFVVQ